MSILRWTIALTLLLVACGCGPSAPELYDVTGTVTFDGQPVTDGEIILFPIEAGQTPDAGPIKDGKFAFKARPGEKKVDIQAVRKDPTKTVPDPVTGTRPALESYIPERYNTKTELTVEIGPGQDPLEFDLKGGATP